MGNASKELVAKQGETWREMTVSFAYSYSRGFLTCRKILDMGPTVLLPSKGSRGTDFYRPQKSIDFCRV
jgi:hypothetical protein